MALALFAAVQLDLQRLQAFGSPGVWDGYGETAPAAPWRPAYRSERPGETMNALDGVPQASV
jgi:hypothetical protein